jgi:hypothetical protein
MRQASTARFKIKPLVLAKGLSALLMLALVLQAGTFALSVLHGLRADGFAPLLTQAQSAPDARILLCTAKGLKWVSVTALSQDSTKHEPLQKNLKPFCPFCVLGGSALIAAAGGLSLPLPTLSGDLAPRAQDVAFLRFSQDMAWPFSQGPPA